MRARPLKGGGTASRRSCARVQVAQELAFRRLDTDGEYLCAIARKFFGCARGAAALRGGGGGDAWVQRCVAAASFARDIGTATTSIAGGCRDALCQHEF